MRKQATTVGGEAKWAGLVAFHQLGDVTTVAPLQLDREPAGFAETLGDELGFVKWQVTDNRRCFKQHFEFRGA
ncbi:hypothetical protein [Streptomyces sp. NPDC058695]|uniref:hypothetical protein n=1 Tax=Streptomyces sp. NPDC058695 TaxID=3346604 RepID=UPI0036509C36